MALLFDARVPVAFGSRPDTQDGDYVLDGDLSAYGRAEGLGHELGCRCCVSRAPAAEALSRLFMQRARGEVAFFRRVLVVCDPATALAVEAALRSHPVVAARFRLA